MRFLLLLSILFIGACNSKEESTELPNDTSVINDEKEYQPGTAISTSPKIYSNERFANVTVETIDEHSFRIRGKAQIFEANFGWVVEDGHNELKKGFQMTDAGAPAWGNFDFTVNIEKQRENSSLILILFESSPKDGSRQHELPILLY